MNQFLSQTATNREQSERLIAIGIKPETADMYWSYDGNPYLITYTLKVVRVEITHVDGEPKGVHEIFTPNELDLSYIDADWEQRRYELAKAAMQGIYSNSHPEFAMNTSNETMAEWALMIADTMIEKLKGGKNETE